MSPQAARVLAALRTRGAHGITQGDFLLPDVIDGQSPITRVAARIEELEDKEGHTITRAGRRGKFVIYRLERDAQDTTVRPLPGNHRAVLVTGDYETVLPGDPVPRRGVAVCGVRLYEDGKHIGRTVSSTTRAAFEYIVEPQGDSLRITYIPESA